MKVTIPAPHANRDRGDALRVEPDGGRQVVLVVDDERNLVRVLEARLRRAGYMTLSAFDGADALTSMRRYPLGAVVLDLSLPDLDGQDTLRAMRAIQPGLPVVLISPYARPDGLDPEIAFLQKPFDLEDLVRAVAQEVGGAGIAGVRAPYSPFPVGQTLWIRAAGEPAEISHPCTVHWQNMNALEVACDDPSRWTQRPGTGDPITVSFPGTDALYGFGSFVSAWRGDARLTLCKPDVIQRVQRRAVLRKPARFSALVHDAEDAGSPVTEWHIRNIGQGGLMMEGTGTIALNAKIVLHPVVPDAGADVSLQAEVVWIGIVLESGLHRIGLRFGSHSAATRRWLRDYCGNLPEPASS